MTTRKSKEYQLVNIPKMNVSAWAPDGETGKHYRHNVMSTRTKDFIQKICYKKTASIDMTQFGFINDRKMHPVNMLLKPLREKLEKIIGKTNAIAVTRKTSPIPLVKTKTNKKSKPSRKMRKGKSASRSSNKELVIRTEDLIAKRRLKRDTDAAPSPTPVAITTIANRLNK